MAILTVNKRKHRHSYRICLPAPQSIHWLIFHITTYPMSAKSALPLGGIAWIALSATGYGSMALFAHWVYADGVSTTSLLALRFLIASLVLGVWVVNRRIALPRGRDLIEFIGLGALFASMAWAYFAALHYASSGLVALLVYIYPVLVAVQGALFGIDRFGKAEGLALAACSAGLVLLLGRALHTGHPLGIVLPLLAGFLYSVYILLSSRANQGTDPLGATWVMITSAGLMHAAFAGFNHFSLPSSVTGWSALVALSCFSSVLAISAFLIGLRHVGPTLASVLSTLEPVVTISLGVGFLGEHFSQASLFGSILVLGAATGLALSRTRPPPELTA
jgi:drug/metabolite transporter (DMT)-like permease